MGENEKERERESAMTFAADWKQKLCPIERRGRKNKRETPDQNIGWMHGEPLFVNTKSKGFKMT